MRTCRLITFVCLLAAGCASTPGPEETARAYAQALGEGRVDDAYALVAPSQKKAGLTEQAYRARYGEREPREVRAAAVREAAPSLVALSGNLRLVREPDGWRVVEPWGDGDAKKVLYAFLEAAEAGDFEAAYGLLGSSLRARYTPALLAQDFVAEPLAKERLARARAAAKAEPVMEGEQALFPIGDGKAVRLRLEDEGYRVVALE